MSSSASIWPARDRLLDEKLDHRAVGAWHKTAEQILDSLKKYLTNL